MKIVFDGRWIGRTGIGRYANELLNKLQELDHENEYLVLLFPDQFESWRATNPNFHPIQTTYEVYTWQEQLLLPWQIWRLKPDLVHFTSFNLPILYPGRFVTTVHDLTLVNFKNIRGQGLKKMVYELKYWLMRFVLQSAVRRAQTIITPAKYTRDELGKLFPVSHDKTVVTHESINPALGRPADISHSKLPKRFLFYIGNYYPYKNIGRLVEAFAKTKARKDGTKLLLAGKPNYFQEQVRAKVEQLGLNDDVIWKGRVSDEELASLYNQASLYVFPSLSEGFGLPGLEAMNYGLPVLSSNASCLPEVYGNAAEYFDPLNVDDMARKIDHLLEDPKRREELRQKGLERIKQFSWEKMAHETLEIYKKAAK